jgi:hypothetical protein
MVVDRIDAQMVERYRVIDRLAGRLHAVAGGCVADRETLAIDRADSDRKTVGVGPCQLGNVGGDFAATVLADILEQSSQFAAERGEVRDHQITRQRSAEQRLVCSAKSWCDRRERDVDRLRIPMHECAEIAQSRVIDREAVFAKPALDRVPRSVPAIGQAFV